MLKKLFQFLWNNFRWPIMDSIRMSHNPYDDFVSVFDMVSIFIRDFRCHFMNVITGSILVQLLKRSNISFFFQFSVLKSCKEFSTENNFWLTAVSLYWVHGCPRQHFDPLQTKWIKIQTRNQILVEPNCKFLWYNWAWSLQERIQEHLPCHSKASLKYELVNFTTR